MPIAGWPKEVLSLKLGGIRTGCHIISDNSGYLENLSIEGPILWK
jgi:hypothetical protein